MGAAHYIAGIGASAGGLEAMLPMFARMPATGRIAYVVAQHMAKDGHDDLVVRLMARESALPVVLATPDVLLQADTVYVIPSGKDGQVMGSSLCLSEPGVGTLSTPSVNVLFKSLAEAGRNRAIGIVLSGTGSDGLLGCQAIRARGGLTLAQDPLEAKFNGMPSAAIDGNVIDQVLSVESVGEVLAERFPGIVQVKSSERQGTSDMVSSGSSAPTQTPPELANLLQLVLKETGIDFSSYKADTLIRRLEKRKSTLGLTTENEYAMYIRRHPDEIQILQHLLLVSVSSFFRDKASFDVLNTALSQLIAGKNTSVPVRVWVPGCASGEEPITLAILLKEVVGARPIEIIATDLNPEALAISQEGVYRQTAFKEMPLALRSRYFIPKGQHFQVHQDVLDCIQYEQRDVLAGPPGTNLDLVSCRNLLIYMKSELQDKLIKSFHYALQPKGLLFIGQAESLSFVGNALFSTLDPYHRLFRRRL
jgi:chemotaxis methyl-accepting protein methylase